MDIQQKEKRFPSAAGNCDIRVRYWIPEEIRGAVQLTHGMAEHIDRYQEFALFLARNGFLVYGHDQAGHGKSIPSEGIPGFFREEDGWTALTEDMRRIFLQVRDGYPAIPFVLFGHSMGSFEDARDRAAGCIVPTPSTGETYRNPSYKSSGCSLKIVPNTASGTNTYFKVYKVEGEKEILVSCVFIRGGATATIKLPAGTYVLKTSNSTGSWYGATEMFGDDGVYQRLRVNAGSDRFKLNRGGQYVLTMKTQNGDVTGKNEPRKDF